MCVFSKSFAPQIKRARNSSRRSLAFWRLCACRRLDSPRGDKMIGASHKLAARRQASIITVAASKTPFSPKSALRHRKNTGWMGFSRRLCISLRHLREWRWGSWAANMNIHVYLTHSVTRRVGRDESWSRSIHLPATFRPLSPLCRDTKMRLPTTDNNNLSARPRGRTPSLLCISSCVSRAPKLAQLRAVTLAKSSDWSPTFRSQSAYQHRNFLILPLAKLLKHAWTFVLVLVNWKNSKGLIF